MSFSNDPAGIIVMHCDHPGCKAAMGCREPKNGAPLPPLPPGWMEKKVTHGGKEKRQHYCRQHHPQ